MPKKKTKKPATLPKYAFCVHVLWDEYNARILGPYATHAEAERVVKRVLGLIHDDVLVSVMDLEPGIPYPNEFKKWGHYKPVRDRKAA
jgi:hypothetical protein